MKIFKKEKAVTALAERYLDVVEQCVESAESMVRDYLGGDTADTQARADEVSRLETEADGLRRDMRDQLFSGAYLPLMRADIFGLFEAIDGIPNASEACCRFFHSERPDIPEEFRERYLLLATLSFGAFQPLRKSVHRFFKPKKNKMGSIRAGTEEISVEEKRVDEAEIELTSAIFASDLDLARKMHLRRALGRIVEISDRAEDTAERLLLIAMKAIS